MGTQKKKNQDYSWLLVLSQTEERAGNQKAISIQGLITDLIYFDNQNIKISKILVKSYLITLVDLFVWSLNVLVD